MKGKLRELELGDIDPDSNMTHQIRDFGQEDWDDDDNNQGAQSDNRYRNEYHFIPYDPEPISHMAVQAEAGPGPQTAAHRIKTAAMGIQYPLLDDNDERVTIWEDAAGHIKRREEPPRYIPTDIDGDTPMSAIDENSAEEPNKFFPFASELDWRVAQWAVKDGPGHNAFDRLLEIPGVGIGSTYHTLMTC